MWRPCETINQKILDMSAYLKSDRIARVPVEPDVGCTRFNCHNNVLRQVEIFGGRQVTGFYFVEGFDTVQAIKHSVWEIDNKLIDITPFNDNRVFNVFAVDKVVNIDYSVGNMYFQFLDKYLMQEAEFMYYVYQLVDPRNNLPFYVGKGCKDRAKTHLWEIPATRNPKKENKIKKIRSKGLEPIIEYIADSIPDEDFAYEIETQMIRYYGRKGIDPGGILTNICIDNRPPNHKGKTYEEIYGKERANSERLKRQLKQLERGGYGPKQHTDKTRKKISKSVSGENNGMYGKKHSYEAIKKMSESKKKLTGKSNKKSHTYKLTSPDNKQFILVGGEVAQFCKEHNLSLSTLKKQLRGAEIPERGKTQGWKFERLSKENKYV